MHFSFIAAAEASPEEISAASFLLQAQWPRGGKVSDYRTKLVGEETAETRTSTTLPQSYLLILHGEEYVADDDDDGGLKRNGETTVVAHGRLTECFEGAGGSAAALTYILAEPKGRGYGTQIMSRLEDAALKMGYHYCYLWTATAVPFYEKLGYQQTERVSLYSACLKKLECEQVNQLEAMLHKKMGNLLSSKRKETVMLPPDEATSNDVWMRKRLVECVGSVLITVDQRLEEIRTSLDQKSKVDYDSMKAISCWKYSLLEIPWQQQVGPSCGLAALLMLRDYYIRVADNCTRMPSLLTEAQQQGYSVDGEIFDASNLVKLAAFCGLNAELHSLQQTTPTKVLSIVRKGGTCILPYDSQPSTKRPHQNAGKTAHYGIVVGIMFGFEMECGNDAVQLQPFCSDDVCQVEDALECRLLVQHSLSRKLAIASWSDFYNSNQQLLTVDDSKYRVENLNLRDCLIVCHGAAETVP